MTNIINSTLSHKVTYTDSATTHKGNRPYIYMDAGLTTRILTKVVVLVSVILDVEDELSYGFGVDRFPQTGLFTHTSVEGYLP